MEEKIIKEIHKCVSEIDDLFEKDNPLSDLDQWCPKNGSIRAHIDSIAVSIGRMKSQLAEKEKEIGELKEKARYLANDIFYWHFYWHSKLEKIISALNKSKKAFKSSIIAEAREQVEKIAKEIIVRIRTWSI